MTQEEKARAYDDALTTAKRIISENCSEVEKLCLKCVFPELAESEDEKMINELQGFLDSFGADYFGTGEWQKFHDWLEKQKEQKQPLSEKFRPDFPAVADFLESVDDMEKNRAIGILEDYLKWAVSSEEECRYTWKELADELIKQLRDGKK